MHFNCLLIKLKGDQNKDKGIKNGKDSEVAVCTENKDSSNKSWQTGAK